MTDEADKAGRPKKSWRKMRVDNTLRAIDRHFKDADERVRLELKKWVAMLALSRNTEGTESDLTSVAQSIARSLNLTESDLAKLEAVNKVFLAEAKGNMPRWPANPTRKRRKFPKKKAKQ